MCVSTGPSSKPHDRTSISIGISPRTVFCLTSQATSIADTTVNNWTFLLPPPECRGPGALQTAGHRILASVSFLVLLGNDQDMTGMLFHGRSFGVIKSDTGFPTPAWNTGRWSDRILGLPNGTGAGPHPRESACRENHLPRECVLLRNAAGRLCAREVTSHRT